MNLMPKQNKAFVGPWGLQIDFAYAMNINFVSMIEIWKLKKVFGLVAVFPKGNVISVRSSWVVARCYLCDPE